MFTDGQLKYHASQPGWPANELAAELLSAREELARPYRAGNLEAENEVWDRLVAERDALRARLARVVKAARDHMDAAHYPEITETPTTTEMALFYALEEVSDGMELTNERCANPECDILRTKYDRLREACLPVNDGGVTCQLCGGLWWGNQTPRHHEFGYGGTCPLYEEGS